MSSGIYPISDASQEALNRALDLLASRARDAPERQRTLRATIEWSYELLAAEVGGHYPGITRVVLERGTAPALCMATCGERGGVLRSPRLRKTSDHARAVHGRLHRPATALVPCDDDRTG
jgi:hypothetical protein